MISLLPRAIAGSLLFLCCFSIPAGAQQKFDLAPVKEKLSKEIKATVTDFGIPSISIALLKNDRIIWNEAFGYSNMRLRTPATSDTIYCTGSCFKPITAMAVMQLVDRGKLKLDDPINSHLGKHKIRDVTSGENPITVRHLLSHHSGIANQFESKPLWQKPKLATLSEFALQLKPTVPPGTFKYSNAGFAVAGLLVEEVSGQRFEKYIVENILKPVGVNTRGPINPTPEMLELLALPYKVQDHKAIPVSPHRFDVFPAGEAYLTVPAMSKILLSYLNEGQLNGKKILSKSSVKEMRTPQFGGTTGLDFGLRKLNQEQLVSHGGGVPGYSTLFILGMNSQIGVYVAANASGAHLPVRIIAQLSIDLLLGNEIGKGLVKEISGLGMGLEKNEESGLICITHVIPKSPASDSGITGGMTIKKINETSVKSKSIKECLALMAGPVGTKVRLELITLDKSKNRRVELIKRKFLIPG